MDMKKRMAFFICAVIIAGAAIVCAVMFLNMEEEAVQAEHIEILSQDTPKTKKGMYIIKSLGGRVAVYDAQDMENPMQVTDIYSETLRSYDQELLEKGIELENQEALWRILEDFGS